MIVKFFELKKKKLHPYKFFLLYGNNKGLIEETVESIIDQLKVTNIYKYEENEIIKDIDLFEENIISKSFFENEKLVIISRSTDKIFKIFEKLVLKNIDDVSFILKSNALEKKSKLRSFFEKNKSTICIPFYEDNEQSLNLLTQKFLKEKGVMLSQQNINLIIERSRGDRINLYNELNKIENFAKNRKKIETEDILKLTNLSENFDFSELVDNVLTKNKRKTLYILNENNFAAEDSILIIRIFLNKLKRLLKIRSQIETKKNIEDVISNFKPPIFWKEKDIVKKQIDIWSYEKIQKLIIRANEIELLIKKNPLLSTNVVTDFVLEQTNIPNNRI
tara:strand:+ start:4082 stop:5083 length:1002 start_codon:yes stop_codon:yes gene_type:complete